MQLVFSRYLKIWFYGYGEFWNSRPDIRGDIKKFFPSQIYNRVKLMKLLHFISPFYIVTVHSNTFLQPIFQREGEGCITEGAIVDPTEAFFQILQTPSCDILLETCDNHSCFAPPRAPPFTLPPREGTLLNFADTTHVPPRESVRITTYWYPFV